MDNNVRETFWTAFAVSPITMIRLENSPGHAEPMTALLDKDAHHAVWFVCRRDNRIGKGGRALAQVMTLGHEVFASATGTLIEETDPAARDKHWNKTVEAWFPGGRNDPALIMLRFEVDDAEVWTMDVSLKGLFRLATGGTIDPARIGEHETGMI